MKVTSLILLFLLLNSCNHKKTEIDKKTVILDTVTPLGHYIRLIKSNHDPDNLELSFGENRHLQKKIEIEHSGNSRTQFPKISDFKDFIGLRRHCGYQCWSDEFFTVKEKSVSFVIYNVLETISEKNIIIYFNSEENEPNVIDNGYLVIMDLNTKERQTLHLENILIQQNLIECIKEIRFKEDHIVVKWLSQEKGPENPILKEGIFKIRRF